MTPMDSLVTSECINSLNFHKKGIFVKVVVISFEKRKGRTDGRKAGRTDGRTDEQIRRVEFLRRQCPGRVGR